ncbi:hypothetical protein L7F22_024479 [Adiantum nelumboides]|nr:hypothetical protein [Adiantum nelumboides]
MRSAFITCIVALCATPIANAGKSHGSFTKAPPMFVFGSSYVDTGNLDPNDNARPSPWSKPYGETWPGTPVGRFSNGYVLTDAIAEALNMSIPVNYVKRHGTASSGLNFAKGGSGVLATSGHHLPISSQIDFFQNVLSSYTPQDLASAIVIYCPSGEDYYDALATKASSLS